jgi:hypothetical protein
MTNRSKDYDVLKSKLTKGTRVICRIDKDEWYTGSISNVDEFVEVAFDDGTASQARDEEIRFIKRLLVNRISKKALTYDQAEPLWNKNITRVIYDPSMEKEFSFNLTESKKPWIEMLDGLRNVSTLIPFNELLTLDFRSPVHEYSLGIITCKLEGLTEKKINSLIESSAKAVARYARSCGLMVQQSDTSSLAISNPFVRQRIRIKLGAFKGGRAYVQITPV